MREGIVMTAREVIRKHLASVFGDPDAVTDELLAALKAEGLFIGPVVATPEMIYASERRPTDNGNTLSEVVWHDMIAEWLRTEGA